MTVFYRRHSDFFIKEIVEVVDIVYPDRMGNLYCGKLRCLEQNFCVIYAQMYQIFMRRKSCVFLNSFER